MTERVLSLRELNRATLARQLLLEPADLPVHAAVGRLAGLQAQVPNPPYIGLWTRLRGFARADLTRALAERRVVRAALMRSTLHLMTVEDHQRFRATLQPALVRALGAFFGKRAQGLPLDALLAAARAELAAGPRTTGELRRRLLEAAPDHDGDALAYAVRAYLPLVQVPPGGTWGSGSAGAYTNAEIWGDPPLAEGQDLAGLLLRYLAAFGPASVMDFQAWSGLVRLKEAFEPLRPALRTFRDAQGRELFDLPDAPLPPADTPAPPRFLPEYDNLLLAHADRTRVIADADRPQVFLSAARVRATFLLDGFVRGAWRVVREKRAATLLIEPFAPLAEAERQALAAEGERLLRFAEDGAASHAVSFAEGDAAAPQR